MPAPLLRPLGDRNNYMLLWQQPHTSSAANCREYQSPDNQLPDQSLLECEQNEVSGDGSRTGQIERKDWKKEVDSAHSKLLCVP